MAKFLMKKKCKTLKNSWKIIKEGFKMYDVENYEFEIYEILDTDFNLAS